MNISYYDTSALLNLKSLPESEIHYISSYVMRELENIKTSANKSDEVKASARRVVRNIISDSWVVATNYVPQKKIEKELKKHGELIDNYDSRILCEALCLAAEVNVTFYTSDGCLYMLASSFPNLKTIYVHPEDFCNEEIYSGWGKYFPNARQMEELYTDGNVNVLGAKINEYCEIFEMSELKDVLKWTGEKYQRLSYKSFKTVLGEKIAPRNLEQKMLFDLLQDEDVKIKLCLGRFGSGKSYIMLAHALNLIQQGKFDKIVFIRNNIEVKDAGKLGYLKGYEDDKIRPYILPIADHIGLDCLDDYLNRDIIEPIPLGFIRGRDIKNAIIFCDEVENMTKQHIQLLIGRVSEGSQLWLAGDLKQVDSSVFERNSGVNALINGLQGDPLFGVVKLLKSERSIAAAKADLLD